MKRLTALFLAVVMLLSMTCVASAEQEVTVTVGAVKGEVGDVVQVPVSISEGHYMVNSRIFLTYDPSALELQTVCDDEENPYFESINTAIIDSSFMWAVKSPEAGRFNAVFATAMSGNSAGGVLFTLTFKLLRETAGEIAVTIPELKSNSTGEGDDVAPAVTAVNGAVNIKPFDPTPPVKGDVTGDGNVVLVDAVRVFYYVNHMLELTDKQIVNADVTGDGIVNLFDAVRLFYYVSGMAEL